MRWGGALGALIAVVVLTVMGTAPAAAGGKGKDKLSKHDRALLIEQRADGDTSTTLVVAAKDGLAASVVDGLVALGGTIEYRDDTLGYLRVSLSIENAYAAAKLDGIEAVDVDEMIPLPTRGRRRPPRPRRRRPGAATPSQNPYMPTGDTGAAAVRRRKPGLGWSRHHRRHPRLGHRPGAPPSLQTTSTAASVRSSTGSPTPTVTDDDPTWVINDDGPTGSCDLRRRPGDVHAPRAGRFSVRRLQRARSPPRR